MTTDRVPVTLRTKSSETTDRVLVRLQTESSRTADDHRLGPGETTARVPVRLRTESGHTANRVRSDYEPSPVTLRAKSSQTTKRDYGVRLPTKSSQTTSSVPVQIWQLAARPSRFTQGTALAAPQYIRPYPNPNPTLTIRTAG